MKKILAVIAGIAVLLLLAVLIAPQFIDWNQYKDKITAEAERLTGREVTIGGDIQFSVLPSPALVVEDLGVANVPGGVAARMAHLEKAEVHVAFLPLLSGRVEVSRVTLVEPVVALEVLPDGRNNWTFEPAEPSPPDGVATGEEPGQGGAPDASPPDVRLNEVEIENGTISYHDVGAGTLRRAVQVNAAIEADSLQGPIAAAGSFRTEGVPIGFELDLGRFANTNAVPVSVVLTSAAGDVRAALKGAATGVESDPSFQGRFEGQAANLAAAVQAVAAGPLPGYLAQRAAMTFDLKASTRHASVDALELRLGETTADGAASIEFGEELSLAAQLAAGTLDLDSWLAMPDVAPAQSSAGQARPQNENANENANGGAEKVAEENAEPARKVAPGEGPPAFTLPPDMNATVSLAVDAIAFNGGIIRQARADAELADGKVNLNRLSALLPGGGEAAVIGALTAAEGEPRFEGQLEARAADLRAVLRWLNIDVAAVPAGRLRTLALTSAIAVTPESVRASGLDLRVDTSAISGEASARLTGRPAFTADLAVDRLNLDAYLPETPAEAPSAPPPAQTPPAEAAEADGDPLRHLDADIALRVAALTYNGLPASDVVVDGRLADGTLTLARASVGDFVGATANASGVVKGLPERPVMENLAIGFTASDPARLLRSLDAEVPPQAQGLGAVSGKGTLNGTLQTPAVDLGLQAAGAEIRLAGTINPEPRVFYNGRAGLTAAEPSRLLSALAVDYRPQGPIGPIDINAMLAVRDGNIAISDLAGQMAGMPVGGSLTVATAGPRPQIAADLTTGRLVLDTWLPADASAAAPVPVVPAALKLRPPAPEGRRPEVMAIAAEGAHSRWSREPIDLAALKDIDANLKLRSEAIVYRDHGLENADLTATLAAGVLTADPVRGALYGGPFAASARVDATAVPTMTLSLTVEGADLARAPAAAKGVAGGRLDASARLATGGASIADLVSALGGEGSLAVRGLDPAFDASGLPVLGPLLGPAMRMAGALDATLGPLLGMAGGQSGPGLANLTAPFTIDRGVAKFDSIRLDTPVYNATAHGTANLAAWRLDMAGEMTLAQGAIGALLGGVKEVPSRCTFGAQGPLDSPNVQIAAGCLPQGLTIPKGGKEGLGRMLEGLIPKEVMPQDGEAAPQQPAPQPTPQPAPEPEKVIRNLLEGLIRR